MVAVMTDEASARTVTSTGRPVVTESVHWGDIERVLPDLGAREALARLGVGSAVVVPLVARGQTHSTVAIAGTDATDRTWICPSAGGAARA